MKRSFKLVFILVISLCSASSFAQCTCKCGFIETQKVLVSLPETEMAKKTLEKEKQMLQQQFEAKQTEYNSKLTTYMNNEKNWSDLVRKEKENELQKLKQVINQFQESSEEILQKKKKSLYEPIISKVNNAIKKVAQEGNFVTIYDTDQILYVSTTQCTDIAPLVKAELRKY